MKIRYYTKNPAARFQTRKRAAHIQPSLSRPFSQFTVRSFNPTLPFRLTPLNSNRLRSIRGPPDSPSAYGSTRTTSPSPGRTFSHHGPNPRPAVFGEVVVVAWLLPPKGESKLRIRRIRSRMLFTPSAPPLAGGGGGGGGDGGRRGRGCDSGVVLLLRKAMARNVDGRPPPSGGRLPRLLLLLLLRMAKF